MKLKNLAFFYTVKQVFDVCLCTCRSFSVRTHSSQYTCDQCGVGGQKTKALLRMNRLSPPGSHRAARHHPGKLSLMSTIYKACLSRFALVVLWSASVTLCLVLTIHGITLNVFWVTQNYCHMTQPPQSFLCSLMAAWELTQAWAVLNCGRTASVHGWQNLPCWHWMTQSLCWSLPPRPPTTGYICTTCTTA